MPHLTEDQVGGKKKAQKGSRYYTSGSGKQKVIHCNGCNENIPIKNNACINEELARFQQYLDEPVEYACPNNACPNKSTSLYVNQSLYRKFGQTSKEKQRYQCKNCHRTFSITPKASRQTLAYKNINIFMLLMNHVPFRRILEIEDIKFQTLYDKIDYIENRCIKYLQHKEIEFFQNNKLERLYLGCDQQFFTLNWTSTYDKRNIILHAVATCDNDYRYCFGMNLNYDPNVNIDDVNSHAAEINENLVPAAYRLYSRIWTESDYWDELRKSYKSAKPKKKTLLESQVHEKYREALERDDIEAPRDIFEECKLPQKGAQIHCEYTLYGHFFLLQRLLRNVEKVRFFLDQDSGMRAACISAFADRILNRTCDAFYIKTNNDVSIHERKRINQQSLNLINSTMAEHGFASQFEAKKFLLGQAIEEAIPIGRWQDRWIKFPFSHAGELNKMACHLTDLHDYDLPHLINLYNKASIHSTDNYFQLTRRRIRLVERPLKTMAKTNQWNGYSAYNPQKTQQLLNIFRAYYNYCMPGKDKKTPAMRIGITKSKVKVKDILYFGSY